MTLAAQLPNPPHTFESKPSLIGQKVRGRYLVESRIGGGNFGNVYRVIDLEASRRVDGHIRRAMKVINVADPDPPRIPPPDYINYRLHQAAREIYYHRLVSSHPNIVTLHEYFLILNREEMFLILDYCAGGDLMTYITEERNPFEGDDGQMRDIILQICGALDFIHTKGVFHKDLKPDNILISPDGRKVFLCDFGLASDTQTDTRGGGTRPYMSPGEEFCLAYGLRWLTQILEELLDNQGFYCPQRADTWTLGIIVLNMLGLWPWDSATIRSRKFRNFMLTDDHLLQVLPISTEANDLIRGILRFHPELRLSVPEISARVLQLNTFSSNPCTESMVAGLGESFTYLLMRLDPIAQRRKELEYFRGMNETSAFNDLSGWLPPPYRQPPPRIRAPDLQENRPPRTNKPHCAPISGIPPPVTIRSPREPARVRSKWWHLDNLRVAGSRYYPQP